VKANTLPNSNATVRIIDIKRFFMLVPPIAYLHFYILIVPQCKIQNQAYKMLSYNCNTFEILYSLSPGRSGLLTPCSICFFRGFILRDVSLPGILAFFGHSHAASLWHSFGQTPKKPSLSQIDITPLPAKPCIRVFQILHIAGRGIPVVYSYGMCYNIYRY
jgi:hypothetical protein